MSTSRSLRLEVSDGGLLEKSAAKIIDGWHKRPAETASLGEANALTIDVEDYFQVEAFFGAVDRADWDNMECRVERNVEKILQLLSDSKSRATFFTLAWIAERYPSLIRRIVSSGHEIASHGSEHRRADSQSRPDFHNDVASAKHLLEDISGTRVQGYRAPSFSLLKGNLWVMEALVEAGYSYSSSTHPIPHDNYGIPEAPRFAFRPLTGASFLEIPVTTMRLFGRNWPCGGGGYFRLLPYQVSSNALRRVKHRDGQPFVFYFHPWEVDPDQPRISNASLKSRLRHYTNLDKMEPKLRRLTRDFTWRRMDEVFPTLATTAV